MNIRIPLLVAVLSLSADSAFGQFLTPVVGPAQTPLGVPVSITVANDNPGTSSSYFCPYRIYNDQMQLIYDPGCPPVSALMGPYGWVTAHWDQRDQNGLQVAPGMYYVETFYEFAPSDFTPIQIGGSEAALIFEGTPTTGQALGGAVRNFYLVSPQDPGEIYFLLGSLGISTGSINCAGSFPLDTDLLLLKTLSPNKIFKKSLGFLNGNGRTTAPTMPLPPDASLVGISFHAAFVVLDLDDPVCGIRRNSSAYTMTIT